MSSNRSKSALAFSITNGSAEAQVAFWVEGNKGVRLFTRPAPSASSPNPRWSPGSVSPSLWPTVDPSKRRACVGTVQGYFQRRVADIENQSITIKGVFEIEIKDDEQEEIDNGVAQPTPLFTRIAAALKEQAPRHLAKESVAEATEWLVDGPLVALGEGEDLSRFTTSAVSRPSNVPSVTKQELEEGYLLTDGVTRFFGRKIGTSGFTDVTFLQRCRNRFMSGKRPIIVAYRGEPGTGKSALVEAAFASEYVAAGLDFNEDALIMGTANMVESDIIGGTYQDPRDGLFKFRAGKLVKCMEAGVPLFIDEAWRIDPSVLSIVFPTIDGRGVLPLPEEYNYPGNVVRAKPGFYIVFAGNPTDLGARLSKALASRTVARPWYHTNYEIALKVVGKHFEEFIAACRNMEEKRRNGLADQAPQMREIIGYADMVEEFGEIIALQNLLGFFESDKDQRTWSGLIKGHMGIEVTEEFAIV